MGINKTTVSSIILVGCLLVAVSCGFKPKTEKSSVSLIIRAEEALSQNKFDEALSLLASFPDTTERVVKIKAIAYAGKAGLNSLEIVDYIENNRREEAGVILKYLAHRYNNTEIAFSRKALETINHLPSAIPERGKDINLLYAVVQLYKASQILLYKADQAVDGRVDEFWDPCIEGYLLSLDIREIVSSINRSVMSLHYANQKLYDKAVDIQTDLKIKFDSIDEALVQNQEIKDFRVYAKKYLAVYPSQYDAASGTEEVCPGL